MGSKWCFQSIKTRKRGKFHDYRRIQSRKMISVCLFGCLFVNVSFAHPLVFRYLSQIAPGERVLRVHAALFGTAFT